MNIDETRTLQHRKSVSEAESMMYLTASACRAMASLQARISVFPGMPEPSSGSGVFLGGSCNPTTWRADLAIPKFKEHDIKFYNPQVDDWSPELVAIEAKAKDEASILLFFIDDKTRCACFPSAHFPYSPLVMSPFFLLSYQGISVLRGGV
jgi:hypothetical protein